MNVENLKRMRDHLLTVPEESFDMRCWKNEIKFEGGGCETIGCVIGHCAIIDEENVTENYTKETGDSFPPHIDYLGWSSEFTGIDYGCATWRYMFAPEWNNYESTVKQAIGRMNRIIQGEEVYGSDLPWLN